MGERTDRRARRHWLRGAMAATVALGIAGAGCTFHGVNRTEVRGRITQSPCGRPIIEGEPPCEDPPVVADVVAHDGDGVFLNRTRTDADGNYRMTLPPVQSRVVISVDLGDPPPTWPKCPTGEADVSPREVVVVDILCGSGMR